MLTRREYLTATAAGSATLALAPRIGLSQFNGELTKRAIPATGEEIPIIGLGSSATFSQIARAEDFEAIGSVFEAMLAAGGTVFDTAPSYGASEAVAGKVVNNLGIADRIFWATKLNTLGFRSAPGTTADPAAIDAQLSASFERYGSEPIDLIQVHNIADMGTQFAALQELKADGRVRYIGTTSTFKQQYDALAGLMRNLPLDFIGIDYAVDNWQDCEERFFPLARERGIAMMVYMPFGRTRLWNRVEGHEVPEWAQDFGAESWAQFFLKFAASHPDVTVVTPATSRPHHMVDNMGAAYGRMPDANERRRMIDFIDALPEA
jgi:aryl-alcohol dehydrogenase-like predicted oxidoreductase